MLAERTDEAREEESDAIIARFDRFPFLPSSFRLDLDLLQRPTVLEDKLDDPFSVHANGPAFTDLNFNG